MKYIYAVKGMFTLAEQILQFVLSTDFSDFATRVLGYGLAALLGIRHLLDGLDSLDGSDGRERIARKRACGGRIRANGERACGERIRANGERACGGRIRANGERACGG